jgi:GT2 family glycosyltransferase
VESRVSTHPIRVPAPVLSLVVASLGRTDQVARLLHSLSAQTFRDFDVTVVDQNDDDRLAPVLAGDWTFPVRRIHTPGERGASRARNRGWRETRGATVLFPDDDCWYSPGFLQDALARMERLGCDALSGRAADETGRSINGRFEPVAQAVTRSNVWTTGIEWMVFYRRTVLEAVGGFDEDVGIGATTPWQSCEHQDILLRAGVAGFRCWYDPDVTGHHDEIVAGPPDERVLRKARGYARGMGFVLRAHGYPMHTRAWWMARALAGGLAALARGRRHMLPYYREAALGRLEGALGRTFSRD